MIPINEAQQQLQQLIDSVSESHQPIVIAGQTSNAVLLSESDWDRYRKHYICCQYRGCGNRFGKD